MKTPCRRQAGPRQEPRKAMKLPWKAALLAPLVAPAIISALLAVLTTRLTMAWLGFMIFFVIGAIIAYPTMFLLFLPGLWALSRVRRPGPLLTCAWGTVLGAL